MFPVFAITGRASRDEVVQDREKKRSKGDHRSPAPTAGVAVKMNSDGRAYGGCCREIEFRRSEFYFTLLCCFGTLTVSITAKYFSNGK